MKFNLFIIFSLLFLTFSCSEFNKVLKSDDNEYKKTKAIEYYEKGEYLNAVTILEEIIPFYRLSTDGEKLYYYYCKGNYYLGDYYLASYYFRKFINQYPNSKYVEECQYLSAMCSVHNSPEYALDQTETLNALDQLQIFIDMYPKSPLIDTCNLIMDNLHFKLETKKFESAKLYYHTENFKAAVYAFDKVLDDYPATRYREEVIYYAVLSRYKLAINSIETKKLERLNDTLKTYRKFVAEFPDSPKVKDLKLLIDKVEKEIELINNPNS